MVVFNSAYSPRGVRTQSCPLHKYLEGLFGGKLSLTLPAVC
jgi:hypothetical protein